MYEAFGVRRMIAAGSTVLITGASSGIGAALAREFVRRGARVALVARRVEQLQALASELRAAGGQASAHRGDVTADGDIARVVAELAGEGAVPGGSAYAMSKFAVRALAEALHGDLKAAGIRVTLISPGFVDSDIRRVDNRGGLHAQVDDPVPAWLRMRTDKAARAMVNAILRGRREVIVTLHAKAIVFCARHLPRLTRFLLVRANRGSRPEPRR